MPDGTPAVAPAPAAGRDASSRVDPVAALTELGALLRGHGPVTGSPGLASGAFSLGLAILCLLSVLAYRFPAYLTTPMLRAVYDADALRIVLFVAMVSAGMVAAFDLVAGRRRVLAAAALAAVAIAAALGGAWVPVDDIPPGTPYIGLDWFVLDLLASTALFTLLERLRPLVPDQPVFREDWQTDLGWFALNHVLVGLVLLTVNALVHGSVSSLAAPGLQAAIAGLPFWIALPVCLVAADLAQYWIHRAFHEVPWLWRFHAIHHSVRTMDWLAGSRLHLLEVVVTRVAVLGPLHVLGFSKSVMDAYVVIVGLQAVLVHSNLRLRLGVLEWLWATPRWHHWHHASDAIAIDRNYAVNFPLIDRVFGTAILPSDRDMPAAYGLHDEAVPPGLLGQLVHPFARAAQAHADRP
ncbi:MAG: sterol desaturase family protein [Burkholderiaceae bacterium]